MEPASLEETGNPIEEPGDETKRASDNASNATHPEAIDRADTAPLGDNHPETNRDDVNDHGELKELRNEVHF